MRRDPHGYCLVGHALPGGKQDIARRHGALAAGICCRGVYLTRRAQALTSKTSYACFQRSAAAAKLERHLNLNAIFWETTVSRIELYAETRVAL